MQKVSTQDLTSKLSSLVERSSKIKLNNKKGSWFHGTYRDLKSQNAYRRSNSTPNTTKVSSLWSLLSPMDEDVRHILNSIGLDRHVRQIAELGIESMGDLRNPYMVTDRQLRRIGMTPSSIERYRKLGVAPPPRLDSLDEKDNGFDNNSEISVSGNNDRSTSKALDIAQAASSLSFRPLLVELGLEEHTETLKKACGADSTRALLLKVPEKDMRRFGIPVVKARKLLDMIRSIEADALTNWNGDQILEEEAPVIRPGRRESGCTVDPILIELNISHLRNDILSTAGTLDVFDILRVTELELVERCRVPRMQARKLRRRALQVAKIKNDNNSVEEDSDDDVAPFDRTLKSGISFGGTPSSSNLSQDRTKSFRRAQSNRQ